MVCLRYGAKKAARWRESEKTSRLRPLAGSLLLPGSKGICRIITSLRTAVGASSPVVNSRRTVGYSPVPPSQRGQRERLPSGSLVGIRKRLRRMGLAQHWVSPPSSEYERQARQMVAIGVSSSSSSTMSLAQVSRTGRDWPWVSAVVCHLFSRTWTLMTGRPQWTQVLRGSTAFSQNWHCLRFSRKRQLHWSAGADCLPWHSGLRQRVAPTKPRQKKC